MMVNSSNQKTILVVDHIPENIDGMHDILKDHFHVREAHNGKKTLEIAGSENPPDLILLDVLINDPNGYQVCRKLKENPDTRDIPVIFMSPIKTIEDIQTAIHCGGVDYLVLPISSEKLLGKLKKHLRSIVGKRKVAPPERPSVEETLIEKEVKKSTDTSSIKISHIRDVAVISIPHHKIVFENCRIYRDAFTSLISGGYFKIVIDISEVTHIDGAGLALLISTNESLKKYGGGLHLTLLNKNVLYQFCMIKLIDIIKPYSDIKEAITGFQKIQEEQDYTTDTDEKNICTLCMVENPSESRYCGYCGSNLVLGKGEKIFEVIRRSTPRKSRIGISIDDTIQTDMIPVLQENVFRIPYRFYVEIFSDELSLSYTSHMTDTKSFEKEGIIHIKAPKIGDSMIPVHPGMRLTLINPKIGLHSKFDSKIVGIDNESGMIAVQYNKDAMVLHSIKNFKVSPHAPIHVSFTVPTLQNADIIYHGKILEISRLILDVFSEELLPVNQCLAVNFFLPDGTEISSPLAVAQKSQMKFMYDVEFKVMDEKENSAITKYMYKRQIELSMQ
jgi:CheY-like chemotaxis protein